MVEDLKKCVEYSTSVEEIKKQILHYLSTIKVEIAVHDDWIGHGNREKIYDEVVICPHCHEDTIGRTKYCPHCGKQIIHN